MFIIINAAQYTQVKLIWHQKESQLRANLNQCRQLLNQFQSNLGQLGTNLGPLETNLGPLWHHTSIIPLLESA